MWKKFQYNDVWQATIPITSGQQGFIKIYRLNGPYDPEYSSGVGQKSAGGWTNWGYLYRRYWCAGSKITVWPNIVTLPEGYAPSNVPRWSVGLIPNQDTFASSTVADMDAARSYHNSKWGTFHVCNLDDTNKGLTHYMSMKRIWPGYPPGADYALWGANPAHEAYWNVALGTDTVFDDLSTWNFGVHMKVRITYYVKMMDMMAPNP